MKLDLRRNVKGGTAAIEAKFDSTLLKVILKSDNTKMARSFQLSLAEQARQSLDTEVVFSDGVDAATLRIKMALAP